MAVPLGHRNHRSSRSSSSVVPQPFKSYCNKNYKIVGRRVALSLDGSELYAANESVKGEYRLPKTVRTIKSYAFFDNEIDTIYLSGDCNVEKKAFNFKYFVCYDVKSLTSDIAGRAYKIFPTKIIKASLEVRKAFIDSFFRKRIPDAVKQYLSYYTYKSIDSWGGYGTVIIDAKADNIYTGEDFKIIKRCRFNGDEYKIPNGVEELSNFAFRSREIKKIIIPKTVKKLGFLTFAANSDLKEVYFEGVPEDGGTSIFDWDKNLERIIIPKGTIDRFKELLPVYKDLLVELL